jgi:poly(3-hydroxybutyrate) depolymerase
MSSQRTRRAVIVVAVLAIGIAGLGAAAFLPRIEAEATWRPAPSATLEFDGRSRTYFVHLPPGYTGKHALPLVLVLHGATESPEGVERLSGMSAKADKEMFIAV